MMTLLSSEGMRSRSSAVSCRVSYLPFLPLLLRALLLTIALAADMRPQPGLLLKVLVRRGVLLAFLVARRTLPILTSRPLLRVRPRVRSTFSLRCLRLLTRLCLRVPFPSPPNRPPRRYHWFRDWHLGSPLLKLLAGSAVAVLRQPLPGPLPWVTARLPSLRLLPPAAADMRPQLLVIVCLRTRLCLVPFRRTSKTSRKERTSTPLSPPVSPRVGFPILCAVSVGGVERLTKCLPQCPV